MEERKKFKEYFDLEMAACLAEKIQAVHPGFPAETYVEYVSPFLDLKELKDRVALLSAALHALLPRDYPQSLEILMEILGPPNPEETGMFEKWYWLMPVAHFVEAYGLEHEEISLDAIYEITQRFTGEYAIRPYIRKNPEKVFALLQEWARDPSFHVRRLASEGSRPRLPWATKLHEVARKPAYTLPILEALKADPSLFVRRSVANHLNDILKDNYQFGMEILERWASDNPSQETRWLIRHALRNLRKKEDPRAMAIHSRVGKIPG